MTTITAPLPETLGQQRLELPVESITGADGHIHAHTAIPFDPGIVAAHPLPAKDETGDKAGRGSPARSPGRTLAA